jgi:hypothetical protein
VGGAVAGGSAQGQTCSEELPLFLFFPLSALFTSQSSAALVLQEGKYEVTSPHEYRWNSTISYTYA